MRAAGHHPALADVLEAYEAAKDLPAAEAMAKERGIWPECPTAAPAAGGGFGGGGGFGAKPASPGGFGAAAGGGFGGGGMQMSPRGGFGGAKPAFGAAGGGFGALKGPATPTPQPPPAITAFLLAKWSEQGSRMSIRGCPRRRLRGSSRRRLRSSSSDGRFWSCACRSDLLLACNLWLHVTSQPLCLPLLHRAHRPTCHTLPDDVGFSKRRD